MLHVVDCVGEEIALMEPQRNTGAFEEREDSSDIFSKSLARLRGDHDAVKVYRGVL